MAVRLLNLNNEQQPKRNNKNINIVLLIIISFLFCITQLRGFSSFSSSSIITTTTTLLFDSKPSSLYYYSLLSSSSSWDTTGTATTATATATTTTTSTNDTTTSTNDTTTTTTTNDDDDIEGGRKEGGGGAEAPAVVTTTTSASTTTTTTDHHGHDDDDHDHDHHDHDDNLNNNGNLATMILLGQKSLHSDIEVLKFEPGSLQLNSKDTLQYCYTDPNIYQQHIYSGIMVTISDKYLLIYRHIPKSGSSTSRKMMMKYFNPSNTNQINFNSNRDLQTSYTKFNHRQVNENQTNHHISYYTNHTSFTFVRDPLSRFFSSYDEAIFRDSPWRRKQQQPSFGPSFLYDGIKSSKEYKHMSNENNTNLVERLERYVKETDGMEPFDTHLRLQVPRLTNPKTGLTVRIDKIYNIRDSDMAWKDILLSLSRDGNDNDLNITFPIPQVRSRERSVNINSISNETKQKICEFGLLDYCCLNMKLPSPCTNLFCKLSYYNNPNHNHNPTHDHDHHGDEAGDGDGQDEDEGGQDGDEDGGQDGQDSDKNNNNNKKRRLQIQPNQKGRLHIIQPWSFPTKN